MSRILASIPTERKRARLQRMRDDSEEEEEALNALVRGAEKMCRPDLLEHRRSQLALQKIQTASLDEDLRGLDHPAIV